MIDLIAVRHGETDWNRIRRLQGHTDIALNATGIDQAARLAVALSREGVSAIHSSDLDRALATARPVAAALKLPVRKDARLRERNYGVLEGKTFGEILELHPDEAERLRLRDASHRMPDGESQREFFERAIDVVSSIARAEAEAGPDRTVVIVTHGGVLDMLYRKALGLSLESARDCAIPNAVINRIRYVDGRFEVLAWAEQP